MKENKSCFSPLEIAMFKAMRELLGEGFVPSYYEECAREFVEIARLYAKGKL